MAAGTFGDRAILDAGLRLDRVPAPGSASWTEVAEFALTFDGHQYRGRGLGEWANGHVDRFGRTGSLEPGVPLPDLRALLFFERRRVAPPRGDAQGPAARYVDALLAAIRVMPGATVMRPLGPPSHRTGSVIDDEPAGVILVPHLARRPTRRTAWRGVVAIAPAAGAGTSVASAAAWYPTLVEGVAGVVLLDPASISALAIA